MPLHSEVEELLGRLPARKGLEKMTLAESRALAREGKVNTSKEPIFVLDLDCDGVPGRLYKPLDRLNAADKAAKKSQMGHVYPPSEIDQLGTDDRNDVDSDEGSSEEEELLGLCIFIHGGGWVIGDPDCYDDVCAKLANQSDCAILSLNYRKAPEHAFPAPLDDCIKGTRWAYNFCEVLGCDPQRIVVCGDSAGGNLATLVTQYSFVPIQMQILIYPVCDCRLALMNSHESGSYKDFESGYLLTKESMKWFVNMYLGGEEAHKSGEISNETLKLAQDPRASPLLASDDVLKAMPPALIITAEYDPLRDEGEDYARRLSSIGVKCSLVRYFGQVHSFFNLLHEGLEDSFLLVAHVAHTISRALKPSGATTPAGGGRGGKGVGKRGTTSGSKKKQQKHQAVASELLSMGDSSNSGRDTPTSFYYRNRRNSSDVGSKPYSESGIYKAANAYSTAVSGILEAHSGDKTTPGLSPGMMGDEEMGGIDDADADAAVGDADTHMRPRQLFQGKSSTVGNPPHRPSSQSQSRSRSPGGVKANKVQFSPYLRRSDDKIIEITPKEAKRLRNARFEYYDQVRQRQQQGLLKSNSPGSAARFSALLNTISKDDSTADHIVRTPVEVQLMKEVLELEGQMRCVEMEKKSKEYFQWLRDREAYYERAATANTDTADDSSSNNVAPSPYRHVLTTEMKESLKKLKHDQKTRAAQRTTYTTEHTRAYMEWVRHNLNAEVGTPGAVKHKVVTGESKHETLLKKFACLHLKHKKQADRQQKVKEANAVNSINAKMIKAVSDHMKYRKPRVDSNRDGQKDVKTLTLEQYHAIKIKTLKKGRQIEESMTPEDKLKARLHSRSPTRGARSKLGDPTEVTLAEAITFNSIDEAPPPPPPRHREMYVRNRETGTPAGSPYSNSPYAKRSTPGSTSRGRSRGRKGDASPEGHAPKARMEAPDFQPGVLYYFDESGNSHAVDSKHAHAVIHSQSPRSIDVIRREEHHNVHKKHHADGHSPYEEHRRKEEEMAVRRQARLSTMNSEKYTNKNIGYSPLTGATPEFFAPESASVEAGHINNSREAKEKNVAGTIAAGADALSKPGLSVSFKHQKDFTMISKHVSRKWRAGNSNIVITEVKTGQGFKDQIRAIYTEYNPDRLDMIDTICATFEGREDTLLMELGKKYDFMVDLVDHEAEAREAARLAEQTRIQELEQRIRELESEKTKAKNSPGSSKKKRGQSPSFKPPTPPVDPQDRLEGSSSPSQSVSSASVSSSPAEAPLSIIRVSKHKDGKSMPESSKSPGIDLSSHELKHEDIDVTMICDDPEEWKEQLTQIYKRYNPERLPILDDIIETFEDRKVVLMNQLGAKYGFKVHLKASTHSTRQRDHIENRLHLHREASRQAEMRAREYHSSSDSSNSSDDDDASSLTHSDDGLVNHQTYSKAKAVSDLLTASKKANEVIQAKHRDVLRGSTTIDSPGSSESGSTASSMFDGVDADGNPKKLKRAHTIHKPRVTAAMEEEAPDRAKMIKEIMAIWQVYEPTKPTLLIDRILDQFDGREAALLANLKKKFHIPDDLTSREASKKVKKASKKAKKEKENAASSSSSLTASKKDRGLDGTTFMPPNPPVASSPAPAPAASTALSSGRALTSASKSNRTVPLSASSINSQLTTSGLHTITEHHGEAASDDNSSNSSNSSNGNLSNGSSPETKVAPPAMRPPSPPRQPSPSSSAGTKNKKQSSSSSSSSSSPGRKKNPAAAAAAAGGGGGGNGGKYDPDANPELDMNPEMAPPPAPQSSSDVMMDHEHEQQQKLRSNSPDPSEIVARLNSVVSTEDTFLSNTLRRGGLGIYGYKDKYNDAVKERTLKVDEKGRLVYASASFKSRKLFGAEEKWPLGQLSRVVLRRPGMELGLAKTHTCAGLTEITLKFREGKRGDKYDSGKKVSNLVFFCQDKSIEQIAIDSFKRVIVEVVRDRDAWMTLYAPHRSSETTPGGSNRSSPPPSR